MYHTIVLVNIFFFFFLCRCKKSPLQLYSVCGTVKKSHVSCYLREIFLFLKLIYKKFSSVLLLSVCSHWFTFLSNNGIWLIKRHSIHIHNGKRIFIFIVAFVLSGNQIAHIFGIFCKQKYKKKMISFLLFTSFEFLACLMKNKMSCG